jgi:hypothetical protein
MLADTAAGSNVNRTVGLATGDYYLVIVDFAGTATTYEVCASVVPVLGGGFCSIGFPSPPAHASSMTAPSRRVRRAPLRRATPFVPLTPSRR